MNIKQDADAIMKMNIKTKAQGDAIIAKYAKRNGQAKAEELRAELRMRLRK